jgi:hypothetical protein
MAKKPAGEPTTGTEAADTMPQETTTPKAKGGQPLTVGAKVTLDCEVTDILQGEFVEVCPEGGTPFMIKAKYLNA